MEDPGIAEHIPALRRYARRLVRDPGEVDDLVQDTLERALRKLHLWEPGNLRAWLMTVMHNVRVNQAKRPAPLVYMAAPDEMPGHGSEASIVEWLDVRRALATLPEGQQRLLAMAALGDNTIDEMAEILGVPVGTVLSRVSRGRARLRALVGRGEDRSGKDPS